MAKETQETENGSAPREEYARELGLQPVGPQLKFSWEDTYKAP